jgi:hypothetical protein
MTRLSYNFARALERFSKPPPSATRPQLRHLKCLENKGFQVNHAIRRLRRSREQTRFIQAHRSAQFIPVLFTADPAPPSPSNISPHEWSPEAEAALDAARKRMGITTPTRKPHYRAPLAQRLDQFSKGEAK